MTINIICTASVVAMVSCTSTGSQPQGNSCTLDFSGNLDASASATGCASLEQTDGGDELLVIDTTSAAAGRLQVSIDLGSSPTTGPLSSDVINDWTAVQLGFGDANCAFSAGSANVPFGSFTLSLASVPDAGTPHGELTVVMYVHQPADADCGPIDIENVHVQF